MKRDGSGNGPRQDAPDTVVGDVPLKRTTIVGFQAPLPLHGAKGPLRSAAAERAAPGAGAGAPPRADELPVTQVVEAWAGADASPTGPMDAVSGSSEGATAPRYTLGPVIGRGGMGEVLSAHDEQIGRPVAIKRLRSAEPSREALTRFLREARIQGRLEHPAIVPVHELWRDDQGRPFFVMKQLAGTTLADVLGRLAVGSPQAARQFSRQRLLRAFADVCLAIEFAHTRGVVHRDLKPANIILGDFGEVYVLDWGVARVLAEDDRADAGDLGADFRDVGTIAHVGALPTETAAGAILGTPGYIAPEQLRADPQLDGRADVYALGAILFEILALHPLHPRGQAAIASALAGVDARPSRRALDRVVPPELDAIVVRATALDPSDRFPTARALGDAVQEFLDGDRDHDLRRELARSELTAARAAMTSGDGPTERRRALLAGARALAFDPGNPQAADLVGRLLLEPPASVPPEVEQTLEREDIAALRSSARLALIVMIAYVAFFPVLYAIGFREAWYHLTGLGLCAFIMVVEIALAPRNPFWSGWLTTAANLALIALMARVVSPFVIGTGPGLVLVSLLATHQRLIRTWLLAALCGGAALAPWLLELAGVLAPRASVDGGALRLVTEAAALHPAGTLLALAAYVVVLLGIAALVGAAQDRERREVRRSLQIQAWQLRELIPRGAPTAT